MKIVFLITRADSIGGAQVYVKNLAYQYQELNNDVTIVAGTAGPLAEMATAKGIKFRQLRYLRHPINIARDVQAVFEVVALMKELRPDIVSISSSKAGIIGRIACYITRTPAVLTVHGWAFTEGITGAKKHLFRYLEKALGFITKKLVVISAFDKQLALKYRVLPERKLELIHNGVVCSPAITKKDYDGSRPLRLVMVARHDRPKDHATVFQAMRQLKNVHLALVGDGPKMEDNIQLAKSMGIEDQVNFLGYQEHVGDILSQSDIFLLVSDYEGFPLSTLEAMCAGLPVLVSDVCGAGEAIEEGYNGYKLRPKDVDGIVSIIGHFQHHPAQVREMGENGRRLIQEKFAFPIMFEKTNALYQAMINNKR
jgi:glycosyltransferase involved in cell wall biosynthesis